MSAVFSKVLTRVAAYVAKRLSHRDPAKPRTRQEILLDVLGVGAVCLLVVGSYLLGNEFAFEQVLRGLLS